MGWPLAGTWIAPGVTPSDTMSAAAALTCASGSPWKRRPMRSCAAVASQSWFRNCAMASGVKWSCCGPSSTRTGPSLAVHGERQRHSLGSVRCQAPQGN
ncbi:hypothetical protein D9M69_559180 [compost metagenome]